MRRAPARCSVRQVHCSQMQMAVCSRGNASHGLFVTSLTNVPRPGKPPEHASHGFRCRRRPVELSYAPDPSCTAQPRARGSKFQFNPSSWARAVPILHLRLATVWSCPAYRCAELQSTCSCPLPLITTTDSVNSIGDGRAESPSEVLKQPTSSWKDAGGRV